MKHVESPSYPCSTGWIVAKCREVRKIITYPEVLQVIALAATSEAFQNLGKSWLLVHVSAPNAMQWCWKGTAGMAVTPPLHTTETIDVPYPNVDTSLLFKISRLPAVARTFYVLECPYRD